MEIALSILGRELFSLQIAKLIIVRDEDVVDNVALGAELDKAPDDEDDVPYGFALP